MKYSDRFRRWIHRDCLRERSTADALLSVGAELGGLARDVRRYALAVVERPERVTVLAFGHPVPMVGPAPPSRPAQLAAVAACTKDVTGRGTTEFRLEPFIPLGDFQIVVCGNLERLDLQGIFVGTHALTIGGPVAYGTEWNVGQLGRVLLRLREVE